MKPFFAIAALIGLQLATTAQAKDHTRTYVGVSGGVSHPNEQTHFGQNEAGVLRDIVVDYDSAPNFGVTLGLMTDDMAYGRGRFEVEVGRWQADLDALSLNDVDREVVDGSQSSVVSGFINAWYDTPVYFKRVRFSLGMGVGMAGVDNDIEYLVTNASATNGVAHIAIPGTQATWAYQAMAGVEVELTKAWSLTGDVRKIELGDYQTERYILNTPGVASGNNGTLDSILDTEWSTLSYNIGVRYKF